MIDNKLNENEKFYLIEHVKRDIEFVLHEMDELSSSIKVGEERLDSNRRGLNKKQKQLDEYREIIRKLEQDDN